MKTLLVTGGLGFIGSNFIRMLLSEDQCLRVINLDKRTYAGNPENLADLEGDDRYELVIGDIGDEGLVSGILDEYEPDAVVNFAAESHATLHRRPRVFVQTNVLGTLRLLEASRKFHTGLAPGEAENSVSCMFPPTRSTEVWGLRILRFARRRPLLRIVLIRPQGRADHLVRSYFHTYGFPVLTTNCSNNYGPFQFPEKLIPLMILNACEGKSLPIYGDGANIRDWLHVKDHCSGILTVLKKGALGETYCIGGNSEKTNLEIVDTICSLLDERHPGNAPHDQLKTFVQDRPGHDRRYAIDCSKIKRELGWSPGYSFDEGIAQTVDWYLETPLGAKT